MGSCVDVHFSSLGIHLSGVTGTRYLLRLSFEELPTRLLPIPTAMQGAPVSHCSPCFSFTHLCSSPLCIGIWDGLNDLLP